MQDRAALESQLEGLLRVAKAHDAGKESYAQNVATELFEDYLRVEERFSAEKSTTEQEVIDSMRKVHPQIFFTLFCSSSMSPDIASMASVDLQDALLRDPSILSDFYCKPNLSILCIHRLGRSRSKPIRSPPYNQQFQFNETSCGKGKDTPSQKASKEISQHNIVLLYCKAPFQRREQHQYCQIIADISMQCKKLSKSSIWVTTMSKGLISTTNT